MCVFAALWASKGVAGFMRTRERASKGDAGFKVAHGRLSSGATGFTGPPLVRSCLLEGPINLVSSFSWARTVHRP